MLHAHGVTRPVSFYWQSFNRPPVKGLISLSLRPSRQYIEFMGPYTKCAVTYSWKGFQWLPPVPSSLETRCCLVNEVFLGMAVYSSFEASGYVWYSFEYWILISLTRLEHSPTSLYQVQRSLLSNMNDMNEWQTRHMKLRFIPYLHCLHFLSCLSPNPRFRYAYRNPKSSVWKFLIITLSSSILKNCPQKSKLNEIKTWIRHKSLNQL